MWLIVTFIAAIIVSAMHFGLNGLKKLKLGFLALMLWGTFVMVLVDHTIAYVHEGGAFIEVTTEGPITNAAILGMLMIVPLLAIWAIAISTKIGNEIRILLSI